MKFGMQLPNKTSQAELLKKPLKNYFLGKFSYFLNPYRLGRFSTSMCMRTGVCRPFERFEIKLSRLHFVYSLLILFLIRLYPEFLF